MPPKPKGWAELKLLQQIDDLMEKLHEAEAQRDAALAEAQRADAGDSSGLMEILPEQEAALVEFLEGTLCRALTPKEAYFLGQCIQGFGPRRVMIALEKKQRAKDPVRAAYAMLQAGAQGKPAQQKAFEFPRVRYWEPEGDPYGEG